MFFCLSKRIPPKNIRVFLSLLLETKVGNLDKQESDDGAYLLYDSFDEVKQKFYFPITIYLVWNKAEPLKSTQIEIAKNLATHFQISIATTLPENHPDYNDEYQWYVTKPNGSLQVMREDLDSIGKTKALVLEEHSEKLLAL